MSAGIERLFPEGEITALGSQRGTRYDPKCYSSLSSAMWNAIPKNERRSYIGNAFVIYNPVPSLTV